MISFQSIQDLKQFGVYPLTGEACGLAIRSLCDLDEDGHRLINKFLNVDPHHKAFNNGVSSMMLPYSIMQDLWVFGAVNAGYKYVFIGDWLHPSRMIKKEYSDGDVIYVPPKGWTGKAFATNDEEIIKRIKVHQKERHFYIERWFAKTNHPGDGLNNAKAM